MNTDDLRQAAQLIVPAHQDERRTTMLPPAAQPADSEQGYQIQNIAAAREARGGNPPPVGSVVHVEVESYGRVEVNLLHGSQAASDQEKLS